MSWFNPMFEPLLQAESQCVTDEAGGGICVFAGTLTCESQKVWEFI